MLLGPLFSHGNLVRAIAKRWNQPAGGFVNPIVFVSSRIIITEQMHADGRALARGFDCLDGVFVFLLEANDAPVAALTASMAS